MVDTIEPVSIKQATETPPILATNCGQPDIKRDIELPPTNTSEPLIPPSELWLNNPVGTSFPTAGLIDAAPLPAMTL